MVKIFGGAVVYERPNYGGGAHALISKYKIIVGASAFSLLPPSSAGPDYKLTGTLESFQMLGAQSPHEKLPLNGSDFVKVNFFSFEC